MVGGDELELVLAMLGDVADLVRASCVCKQWYTVATSDRLWLLLLQRFNVPMEQATSAKQAFATYATRFPGCMDEYSVVSRVVSVLQSVNPQAKAPVERNPPFKMVLEANTQRVGIWQPQPTRHERLLLMLYYLFTDMTANPRILQRGCAACFGFFISYNDVYAMHLMNRSAVEVLPLNTVPFVNIAALAWSPDMEEGLGLVLEGQLVGHVIRYGKSSNTLNRMGPIYAQTVPYQDLGLFEHWLTEFARQIKQRERVILKANAEISAPSGFLESGPGVGEITTQGIRVHVSTLFLMTMARVVYRITFTYLENECKYKSVQLARRHWIFKYTDGRSAEVDGEGVVGHYPILQDSQPQFSYCSYTDGGVVDEAENNEGTPRATLNNCVESLEGYFEFVPGTLDQQSGPTLQIAIPFVKFVLPTIAFERDDELLNV
ncbi:hypothetical protein THRCLA_03069 [Thraustotheca clavata]|uniref:ApaG domain-containing protein n=1 Tax=Thraustotheca clavata TaxID=74557 RepID=A0A1W0A360_9STRA|nr:hypothetical protein THRCLA_03069 [Thraustotheca clavata]